jgi:hypothetical protein
MNMHTTLNALLTIRFHRADGTTAGFPPADEAIDEML